MTREHRGRLLFYSGGIFCLLTGIVALRAYMGLLNDTSIHAGLITGAILGAFASIHLHLTWTTRIARGQESIQNPTRAGCLLPLIVAVGVVLGSYVLRTVPINLKDTVSFAFLSFFIVWSAFLLVKTLCTPTID